MIYEGCRVSQTIPGFLSFVDLGEVLNSAKRDANRFFTVLLLSPHLLNSRHPVDRKSKCGKCAVTGYCSFHPLLVWSLMLFFWKYVDGSFAWQALKSDGRGGINYYYYILPSLSSCTEWECGGEFRKWKILVKFELLTQSNAKLEKIKQQISIKCLATEDRFLFLYQNVRITGASATETERLPTPATAMLVIEVSDRDGSVSKGQPAQECQHRVHLTKGVTLGVPAG